MVIVSGAGDGPPGRERQDGSGSGTWTQIDSRRRDPELQGEKRPRGIGPTYRVKETMICTIDFLGTLGDHTLSGRTEIRGSRGTPYRGNRSKPVKRTSMFEFESESGMNRG